MAHAPSATYLDDHLHNGRLRLQLTLADASDVEVEVACVRGDWIVELIATRVADNDPSAPVPAWVRAQGPVPDAVLEWLEAEGDEWLARVASETTHEGE